jgi:hypothetical protein
MIRLNAVVLVATLFFLTSFRANAQEKLIVSVTMIDGKSTAYICENYACELSDT